MKKSNVFLSTIFILLLGVAYSQTNIYYSGSPGIPSPTNKVGIGVSTPSEKLDVNGTTRIRGSIYMSSPWNLAFIRANLYYNGSGIRRYFDNPGLQVSLGNGEFDVSRTGAGPTSENVTLESLFNVNSTGQFRIGATAVPTGYKFAVDGSAIMEEVKVETTGSWPDYVFSEDYKLLSLRETEDFIKAHNHLPGIPSANEVEAEGIALGEMNAKLLEKIEELVLYVIELNKKNLELEGRVRELED